MKRNLVKTVLTASIGSAAIFAGTAHAQSSVTLYGIIDTGLTYVNNAATATGHSSLFKYSDGVAQGSRWGLQGVEDLGGGLHALFTLENGFDTGTGVLGNGGSMFGRQAFVGVQNKRWGTLTFGRQYSVSASVLGHGYSMGSLTRAGAFAYHMNDIDGLTGSRFSNAIKYMTPNYAGLQLGGIYGFSNQAGAFSGAPTRTVNGTSVTGSSRAYAFAVDYEPNAFGVAGMYSNIRFPGLAVPSAFTTTVANVSTGATIRDLRSFGFGTHYNFGTKAMIWGNWTNSLFSPIGTGSSTLNAYEVGGRYNFAPDFQVGLGYTLERLSGTMTGHWNQVNSVFDYFLSKRTDVYLLVSYQKASGSNRVGGVAVPVQAEIGSGTSFVGNSGTGANNQVAVHVALRTAF